MANEKTYKDRLHWTGGFYREPVWPREPDVEVVRSLAKRHLVAELPTTIDDGLLEVSFFAEGGFNKLYQISYTGRHKSYLLRVAIPIVPYYKTEGEVATIAYLRANTSIPVPCVYAWDSNHDNELTFEWILMDKMHGIPLYDVWRKVPWERKLELTETIAGMIKQLWDHKFDRIGGLFFKSAVDRGTGKLERTTGPEALLNNSAVNEALDDVIDLADGKTNKIALPSALQNLNFDDASKADTDSLATGLRLTDNKARNETKESARTTSKNAYQTADPQPINNSQDESKQLVLGYLASGEDSRKASITLEENEDKSGGIVNQATFSVDRVFDHLFFKESRLYLPGNRGPYKNSLEWLSAEVQVQLQWAKNGLIEEGDDYASDHEEQAPMMEALCHQFLDYLPTVLGEEEKKDSFTLHHHDLNAANILIHPETFEVIGIVDWELINVVPEWRTFEHPDFLQYMDPTEEEEPPIPSYENENDIAVELRDRWDYRTLRRHFDEIMKRLTRDDGATENLMKTKVMRDCHEYIPELTSMLDWARDWLETYKTTGVSKNHEDWSNETLENDESNTEA